MSQNESPDESAHSFSIVHALMVILLPIILFVFLGCVIKDHLEPNDGAAIDVGQKDAAVKDAVGDLTILDTKLNEWSLTQVRQSIFGGEPNLVADIEQIVSTKEMSTDPSEKNVLIIKIKKRITQYDPLGGPPTVADSIDSYKVQLTSPSSIRSQMLPKMDSSNTHPSAGVSRCEFISSDLVLPPGYTIEYHNLVVNKTSEPAPDLVRASPNCAGIPQCSIRTTFIEYDEILYDAQRNRDRQHCTFKFSRDVPYLSTIMKRCFDYLADTDKGKVPVRLCYDVANFTTGS